MNTSPVLELIHLSASYNKKPAIYDVSLTVPKGKLIGVIGPNGAGKSTLMKACLGLIPSTQGTVRIFGKPQKKGLRHVGYIPQRETIDWDFPVNVYDVVMMGCYHKIGLFRRPRKEDHETVQTCLQKVGMLAFKNQQISNLSGGQQQRVFLARALAQESDLYFMDEPFTGVDAATEKTIIAVLNELKNHGSSLLVIHHDLATVPEYFDTTLIFNKQVIAYGPTQEVFILENLQTAYEGKLHVFQPTSIR